MERRGYLAAVLGAGTIGAFYLSFLTRKNPYSRQTEWVINDQPILVGSLSTEQSIPTNTAIISSQETATETLLLPEPFANDINDYYEQDYSDAFVGAVSVHLPAGKTASLIKTAITDETYRVKIRIEPSDAAAPEKHYEHLLETWLLDGHARPSTVRIEYRRS